MHEEGPSRANARTKGKRAMRSADVKSSLIFILFLASFSSRVVSAILHIEVYTYSWLYRRNSLCSKATHIFPVSRESRLRSPMRSLLASNPRPYLDPSSNHDQRSQAKAEATIRACQGLPLTLASRLNSAKSDGAIIYTPPSSNPLAMLRSSTASRTHKMPNALFLTFLWQV